MIQGNLLIAFFLLNISIMKIFLISFILLILPNWLIAQNSEFVEDSGTTKIILVRHAEKENDGSKDPSLSAEGQKRAEKLNEFLSDTKIDGLYATPYKRTRETLKVISENQELKIQDYNPSDTSFCESLLEKEQGKTVVIAGHSNTVPFLVNCLIQSETYSQLPESEFGKIWILIFQNGKLIDCSVYNY